MASISNAAALAACDAVVDLADGGAGAAVLNIYSGTAPTLADDSLSGNTLLAELTMSDPAFGAAADITPGARATANAITSDTSANASGTASFFRILDSNSNVIVQGTVSATGGGGELQLNSVSISAGVEVEVTSLTITLGES